MDDPCGPTLSTRKLLNPSFKGSRVLKHLQEEDLQKIVDHEIERLQLLDHGEDKGEEAPMIKWPTGMDPSRAGTADLCDFFIGTADDLSSNTSKVKIFTPGMRDFGGLDSFSGQVTTLKCYESNPLVRKTLNEDGTGRVLVIDGSKSTKCALVGDRLAEHATNRGWSGIVVNGCVRDVDQICKFDIGIKALASNPLKPGKRDLGQRDIPVCICDVLINPGDWLYADRDGIIVSPDRLELPDGGPVEKVALTIPE